jgi:hypothetical protein
MSQRLTAFLMVLCQFVVDVNADNRHPFAYTLSTLASSRPREAGAGDLLTAFGSSGACTRYTVDWNVLKEARLRGGGKSQSTSSTYSERKAHNGITKDRVEEKSLHPGSRWT